MRRMIAIALTLSMLLMACGVALAEGAPTVYFTSNLTPEGMMAVYEALGWTPTGKVAVKLSTGEPPARTDSGRCECRQRHHRRV